MRLNYASIGPLRRALLRIAVFASFVPGIAAAEDDPFGFYVGGAVGESNLRSGNVPYLQTIGNVQGDLHSDAAALFGVAYLPLPVPVLDVFAKAGVARYQTSDKFSSGALSCREPLLCIIGPVSYGIDRTDARFAYGAGTQVKLSGFAIRAEYERIAAKGADPDLLSLGLTWRF